MTRTLTLAAAMLSCVVTLAASADEDRYYVSGTAQYVLFDGARNLKNGFGAQLGFGVPVTNGVTLELNYFSRSSDLSAGGSFDQSSYGLDGLFFIDHDGAMDPYFVLGMGQHSDDYGVATDDYQSISLGVGVIDWITSSPR